MNGLGLAATLAILAALGPVFGGFGDRGKQPQPFDEKVTLPGKIPATAKSLSGAWQYGYHLDNADLEGGKSDLIVGSTLILREDGTYQLEYHARWNLPAIPLPGASPQIPERHGWAQRGRRGAVLTVRRSAPARARDHALRRCR